MLSGFSADGRPSPRVKCISDALRAKRIAPMYADVAVNFPPVKGTFHYHIPEHLKGGIRPGHLVTVPFGSRRVQGVVISLPETPAVPETRPIEVLLDPEPVVNPTQLELARWLHSTTLAPLIDALTLMLPTGLSQKADTIFTLEAPNHVSKSRTQQRLIDLLTRRGPLRGRQIQRALPRLKWRQAAERLARAGVVSRRPVLDPPRVRPRRIRTVRLALPPGEARDTAQNLGSPHHKAADRRRAILEVLVKEREPLDISWVYAETGAVRADLIYLQKRGLIALSEAEVWRDPLEEVEFVPMEPPRLTTEQEAAWQQIRRLLQGPPGSAKSPILLHGVTGSGKTEIYLRAVSESLSLGRRAIILVPEIALTPQTVRRFLARFPGQVGLMHSQLSEGERYDTWRRARSGLLKVIVGPRSALFSPLTEVGLIVVDESHDESYKEQVRSPRYHGRETAIAYARLLNAVCILGSATPDVVTAYRAERGEILRLELPQRILAHRERVSRQAARTGVDTRYRPDQADVHDINLPPVRVVDMRQELRAGVRSLFSRPLQQALRESLEASQQSILFLNRRGSATYIFCRDCGWVARCPRCETTLTYHTQDDRLRCHQCNYVRRSVQTCPDCDGERVRQFGAGTQRIEAEVARAFPGARTLRWDSDIARGKASHDIILTQFAAHRADVLIGTQIVAKGLDLPLVTLVGVVSADTGLNLPDFRASERTFQVLTQVAGRAGRGLLGGRVILQTYHPDHYVIKAAANHDYQAFYKQELRYRRSLGYPPYRRLARLVYRHMNRRLAEEEANRLARVLHRRIRKRGGETHLIGPAPPYFHRLRGEYRWQIILRANDPVPLIPEELADGWSVDIDPVTLL